MTENCEICKRYKKPPPIPIVGLPLATTLNECVAMDLIVIKGKYVLHLIDVFTRFSLGCVRNSKKQEVITDAIMKIWIGFFGNR